MSYLIIAPLFHMGLFILGCLYICSFVPIWSFAIKGTTKASLQDDLPFSDFDKILSQKGDPAPKLQYTNILFVFEMIYLDSRSFQQPCKIAYAISSGCIICPVCIPRIVVSIWCLTKAVFPTQRLESQGASSRGYTWTVLNPLLYIVASFLKAEWMYIPMKDSSFGMFCPQLKLRKPTGLPQTLWNG